jgi:hypothetical protein
MSKEVLNHFITFIKVTLLIPLQITLNQISLDSITRYTRYQSNVLILTGTLSLQFFFRKTMFSLAISATLDLTENTPEV